MSHGKTSVDFSVKERKTIQSHKELIHFEE